MMDKLTAWITEAGCECLQRGDGPVRAMAHECEETGFTVALVAVPDLAKLKAQVDSLLAACQNARDIIETERSSFVDCQRLRDTRTQDPIAHGLVWVDDETWIAPEAAEPLRDLDRALAQIDAAMVGAPAVSAA